MCVTPGSEWARSSSTPSNAPNPSRAGCGFHIRAQPAPGAPGPDPAGAVLAPGRDGLAEAGRPTAALAWPLPEAPPDVAPAASGPGAAAAARPARWVPKSWTARAETAAR